ncbi:hypothetical protein INT47_006710 [Mucor saturninus]|uniref:F-box domain-containing protein n=1 Tax=Mucor saturninus TaxID=64648 RepID=A0A8H7QLQ9_9FUNG|nr:hypothetical protein INT47_006710 [Mucor saturninus]
MASWGALPFEILYCILTQVDQLDLGSCLYTCRSWHLATQGLIYNSVKLSSPKQLTSFADAMTRYNGPSQMVKKITISFPLFTSDRSLADIFRSCRFIKTMDPVHFRSPVAATAFYTTLMQHPCPLLENIPFPEDGDTATIYAQAAWHLRDRLLRLMIWDHLHHYQDSLVAFSRLKYLLCHVSGDTMYDTDRLIQTSRSLRSVEINQRTRMDETWHDEDHHERTPCRHIKEWIGSGLILPSRRLLLWLMHVFPNLEYLHIFFAMNTLKSQLSVENVLTTDIAVQFMLHTYRNIPTLNLEQMYVLQGTEVAGGFLKKSGFDGTLEIRYENDYHHPEHVSLTHTKILVKCVQPLHTPYTILPHRDLIRRFGRQLTGFVLDFGDAYTLYLGDGEVHRNDVHGYCLDYVLKHCPQLRTLELRNFLFWHCDNDSLPMVLCRTLHTLVFDCCVFSNTALEEISKRLPYLGHLSILDSDFEYDSIWEMPMYDTGFDVLHCMDTGHEDSEDDYHEFHLCLEMEQQTLFYWGHDRHGVVQMEEDTMYHHTFDMDDKLTIRIACKSITAFHLDIPNIKTLIKYPGQPNQQIFVHPSDAYFLETSPIISQRNS